ncbi:MAG: cobalt-precorrin-6A reductase [Synechococcales cyanobacterium M58_A2018_015]|nr:cobalt-precorrin-6A reductase [Synechococcales cyanobacterium M58_A2018_015]
MKRVLVLGGTTEATALVSQLIQQTDIEVTLSLAGRTQQPLLPPCQVQISGFGGAAGLADYLRQEQFDLLIDATHPFAAQISLHAAVAARWCHLPRLMLVRPAWQPHHPNDHWIEVDSVAAAAAVLPRVAQRVFLTIGRQDLSVFAALPDLWFLMRMIDPPPAKATLPRGEWILERGPFTVMHETALLLQHQIEAIVSKNSGGAATAAKLIAARDLGIPVVMVQRPPLPEGEQVSTVAAAIDWVTRQLGVTKQP